MRSFLKINRIISMLMALVIALLAGCQKETVLTPMSVDITSTTFQTPTLPAQETEDTNELSAAVLYADGEAWKDTLDYLNQGPTLALQVQDVKWGESLDGFDMIYADESLLALDDSSWQQTLMDFTQSGGAVFLPNGFLQVLPHDYLGISQTVKLDACLKEPNYPVFEDDLDALQQVIEDFSELYPKYANYAELSAMDYGYGMKTDTAVPLVNWGDTTVYAMQQYGEGLVFLSNPLLPNDYSCGSMSMLGDAPYASTTTSFNQLLLCGFAEYVSKCVYGYALERVYGYFGTPSMSWELHYEEITGIANDSLGIFSRLCEQYRQIPSFTLIRNSYYWFRRSETATYLCNTAADGYEFSMDLYESAYSSGTHIAEEDLWLSGTSVEDGGSYFMDYPEYTNRAFVYPSDYDADGNIDLLRGSEDGKVYLHRGYGMVDGRLKVRPGEPLTHLDGTPLSYGAYSAPCFEDIDSDGLADLVCGWSDGVVRWFRGNGSLAFEPMGRLMELYTPAQALPTFGDFNADGIADLCVGSNRGDLILYYGENTDGRVRFSHGNAFSFGKLCVNENLGQWLSPSAVDYNCDGLTDLAVGVFDGYIALFLAQEDGTYQFSSYLTTQEMNYKGNFNIKFGNWASPSFADLNGDGKRDLFCGYQEYGMAYPIDSEYFPYAKELQSQVEYAKEHDYYVGVHFYTNAYASAQRETYELQAHKKAFEQYGLSTDGIGVNQHTWYTSSLSGNQTMNSIYDAGFLWQSGFASPNAAAGTPQVAAENVVALPFFLRNEDEQTLLMQNNSVVMYTNDDWYAISARYEMPICLYYHCDFAYEGEAPHIESIEQVQRFREKYGYNFNREDQLMLASAAALQQSVQAQGSLRNGLTLTSDASDEIGRSLGVRVLLSRAVECESLSVDADVWQRKDCELVLGLNRTVCLTMQPMEETTHISRINMAAELTMQENGAKVQFLSGGMMELAVVGKASTTCEGWIVTEQNGETIFTKFGNEEILELSFEE